MLLYHAIRKTYDDFDEVYQYRFDGANGALIETDKELKPGQIIILKYISEYAIIVEKVWEMNGKKYFSHNTADEIVVRGRVPRNNAYLNREERDIKGTILDEFCKSENCDPDMTTQINGEKRAIAKNLFKKYAFMSVQDVAEITRLPMEQVIKLEREVR